MDSRQDPSLSERRTVLIIGAPNAALRTLQEVFSKKYDTILCTEQREAEAALLEKLEKLALILLDFTLPEKAGRGMLSYLCKKKLMTAIPVVVYTDNVNDYEEELKAYGCGIADIIHTPYAAPIILRRTENLMELYESRRSMEWQLEQSNTRDRLTGLLNMKQFLYSSNLLLRKADEEGSYGQYSFVYCNIRNFKYYNIRYGSWEGNQVLRGLARLWRDNVSQALLSRFGNDHFVAMLRGAKQEVTAQTEKLIADFQSSFSRSGMKLKAGIFPVKKRGETAEMACDLAKIACDAVRQSARNFAFYNERLEHDAELKNHILCSIDDAIQNQHIKVHYQPVIRTLTGALCGMEALARWSDPELGFLSPASFIPVLEENRQITKLDLYMLREVCREMKEAERQGLPLVPISFNLSRLDFLDCDIFSETERIVLEYGIARDMINIEVTESTVMEEPELIGQELRRFREGGYQVWMDDFGSGYSSLNVLKDYQFDEIKLDMAFLSTFDEKSKKIVKSIILMAKEIGVQILAEGVETEEQFRFLRDAGCERVQGYFFSRPLPWEELLGYRAEKRLAIEPRGWKSYFDRISHFNFITERSLAIVEYDGRNFRYLYSNAEFRDVWVRLGVTDLNIVYEHVNSTGFPLSQQLRDLQHAMHTGMKKQFVCSLNGQYVQMNGKCISEQEQHATYALELMNLSDGEIQRKQKHLDKAFRMMYGLYDTIYLLDLSNASFMTLRQSACYDPRHANALHHPEKINMEAVCRRFIHPEEWQLYRAFFDMETLRERLIAQERGYLARYFRTRTANGAYIWKVHTMLYIPEDDKVIYCSAYAPLREKELLERIAPEQLFLERKDTEQGLYRAIRRSLEESQTIRLFWKDREHRFRGANAKFLESYGFRDSSELIGKTDEEMGWHIDEAAFRDDERRVLENGEVIHGEIRRCIIRGVAHNILISKEPLYEDGEIVGLLGTFLDTEELRRILGDTSQLGSIDRVTGLMSAQGITNVMLEYVESWITRGENFAVIRLNIQEYSRAVRDYGEETVKRMLRECAERIRAVAGNRIACARLYNSNFVLLMKCTTAVEVEQFARKLRRSAMETHTLVGFAVTINPELDLRYASDCPNMQSLIGYATGGSEPDCASAAPAEQDLIRRTE